MTQPVTVKLRRKYACWKPVGRYKGGSSTGGLRKKRSTKLIVTSGRWHRKWQVGR